MKAITIEVDSKGKTSLAKGLEVCPSVQRKYVKGLKLSGIRKGLVGVYMVSLSGGVVCKAMKSTEDMKSEAEQAKKDNEKKAKSLAKK